MLETLGMLILVVFLTVILLILLQIESEWLDLLEEATRELADEFHRIDRWLGDV